MVVALTPVMAALGVWAVLLVVGVAFAETGLLLGFFLPGDSLLFAAGVLVATGAIHLPVALVVAAVAAAAVAGDQVGYLLGRRFGPWFFREGRRFPRPHHREQAAALLARHGATAVVLARFVPLARTMTPAVAGAAGMSRTRFTTVNVVGGVLWSALFVLGGRLLGGVPLVAHHVELLTLAMVAASVLLALAEGLRRRVRARRRGRGNGAPVPDETARPVVRDLAGV